MGKTIALVLCLVLIPPQCVAGDVPPNILLIITDQHTGPIRIGDEDFNPAGRFPDLHVTERTDHD